MVELNIIQKLILKKYPNYDLNRYHYKCSDIINHKYNGAQIIVEYSAIEYIQGYVIKSGFGMKKGTKIRVNYDDLEYYAKDQYIKPDYNISSRIRWEPGDIVRDPDNGFILLITEYAGDGFYALVLDSNGNEYYDETSIYVLNRYSDYIMKK